MNQQIPETVSQLYFWILITVSVSLASITLFFIKKWISTVENNQKSIIIDLTSYKSEVEKEIYQIKQQVLGINKENSILDTKIEKFITENKGQYDSIRIHLEYQKDSIKELKEKFS